MADVKISAIPSGLLITDGAGNGTDKVVIDRADLSGTFVTTTQAIADLAGGGGGGFAHDFAAGTTIETVKLGNDLSTSYAEIENASGTPLLKVKGDGGVTLPTGYIGLGTDSVGAGFGGHKFTVVNSTSSSALKLQQAGGNGKALELLLTATAGTQYGLYMTSTASNVNVYGSLYKVTGGGGGDKCAINIMSGTIKMPVQGSADNVHGGLIGTATNQEFAFWGATPQIQPTALTAADATATNGTIGTADTIINNLRVRLNELETKLSAATGGIGIIA